MFKLADPVSIPFELNDNGSPGNRAAKRRRRARAAKRDFAAELLITANSVYSHPALQNAFYQRWMTAPLNAKQFAIFSANYWAWIWPTVDRIERAMIVTKDPESRLELFKNLMDEYGGGKAERVHTKLLWHWLNALHLRIAGKPFDPDQIKDLILPATKRLTKISLNLCARPYFASGAILAQEWHAFSQLTALYEGYYNQYRPFWTDIDEFYSNCEYLLVHIAAAEKEHKKQAIFLATRDCWTDKDFQKITSGFDEFLCLLADFWRDLEEAMQRVE